MSDALKDAEYFDGRLVRCPFCKHIHGPNDLCIDEKP